MIAAYSRLSPILDKMEHNITLALGLKTHSTPARTHRRHAGPSSILHFICGVPESMARDVFLNIVKVP